MAEYIIKQFATQKEWRMHDACRMSHKENEGKHYLSRMPHTKN